MSGEKKTPKAPKVPKVPTPPAVDPVLTEPAASPTAPTVEAKKEPETLSEFQKAADAEARSKRQPIPARAVGVKVRAKETGFYRGNRQRKGSEFRLAAGDKVGKWMDVIEG